MCQYIVLETRGILSLAVFESLAERVRGMLWSGINVSVITCASSLAKYGLLGSVKGMRLWNIDLTSVPAEHLASLVSSVTGHVHIREIRGCDLVNILDNVKSEVLVIKRQSLGSEETQALVRAMESVVVSVELTEEVTLDIRALMEYSGQGKCRVIECQLNTADRYRKHLRRWAKGCNWAVTFQKSKIFRIERM